MTGTQFAIMLHMLPRLTEGDLAELQRAIDKQIRALREPDPRQEDLDLAAVLPWPSPLSDAGER